MRIPVGGIPFGFVVVKTCPMKNRKCIMLSNSTIISFVITIATQRYCCGQHKWNTTSLSHNFNFLTKVNKLLVCGKMIF